MNIYRLLMVLALIAALIFGVVPGMAQESPASLRELADLNDIYVGAAVYTYHLDNELHQDTLSREFNLLTPEQEAKACEVQAELGQFDFQRFDRLVAFAEENDMVVRGHTLVWHQCVPEWLENGQYSRQEAIQLLRDHIMTVMGRYKGRVAIWDVVNEGVAEDGSGLRDTPWRRLIGDDYIELAFNFAREADPDALLFYNEIGAEGLNDKSNTMYDLLADLLERGVPIDGVGLQMHINLGDTLPGMPRSQELIRENIRRLGELGLQVQITEMDVAYKGEATESIFQQQAGDYYRVMDTCLNSDYCTAFIVWGVTDSFSWLRDASWVENPNVKPLLFDENYQPKPAYFALLDLLARRAGEDPVLSDEEVEEMLKGPGAVVEIPEPTKTDPAQLAPDSVPGAAYYAPFPLSITLDGDPADWANVPHVTIDSGPTLPLNHDTAMTFAVAADDTQLYFLAEVQDSKVTYGTFDAASDWYKEDSIEFYINATGDLSLTSYKPGVVQIGIMAANILQPDELLIGGYNSTTVPVSAVVVETDEGYLVEASVPLVTDVWTIEPEHLGVLGFQAHLNGASTTAGRDTKLIWSLSDTQDQSYTNPSLFGQLIFWDVAQQP